MTQPEAIIGIGLPASGKSTLLKPLAQQLNAEYVCPDEIRRELGDVNDQSRNDKVWEEAYHRIGQALSSGRSVVVDVTNCNAAYRRQLVAHCRQWTDQVKGAWFRTQLKVCLQRNQARERHVPEKAIRRMEMELQTDPPSLGDGFSKLVTA